MDMKRIKREASELLPLAQRVLARYPFQAREVTHLATHSNVMYRVISDIGQQMVLRIGTPHANTRTNIQFEVEWLDALARETDLDVVRPIETVDGSLIVDEHDTALEEVRSCVLFSWVPGAPLGTGAGSFGYRLLGQMAASLQEHGRSWQPAEGTGGMRRWDRLFYYGTDVDQVVVGNPVYGHLFEIQRRTIILKASDLATRVIKESWAEGGEQVVHGDLHEWNVHMAASRLYAFDFEDVMVALPAQDVAISLYQSRSHSRAEEIQGAFRRGFESVAPWPIRDASQLDGFHAARQIMLMNYAARTLPVNEARDYIDSVMPWLDDYTRRYG
jgi:Ser/Thr protein kinase RdoA (MazF antagonist)